MGSLCLIAVAASAFCSPAAPGHAEIAFASDGRIWSSRADGSERRLLIAPTRARESLAEPVWSPDGTRLAYVRAVGETAQLMSFDGTRSHAVMPLRDRVLDSSPAWSPDGTAVAFVRAAGTGRSLRSSIVTRSVATGAERPLASVRALPRLTFLGEPSWSPDGTTIAYTESGVDREYDRRPEIRTVAAGGGPSRLLIDDAQSPDWAPDGRLAFASIRDENDRRCGNHQCRYAGELYTAAADGSGETRLTRNKGDDAAPAWSPDGSRILFTSDRNLPEHDSDEVYSVAADGSCLTWLTNGTPASGQATWRPGSGDQYDPGSCNRSARPALADGPTPRPFRGGLWLGRRHRGLLLSSVQGRSLAYYDCARFDPRECPEPVILTGRAACRMDTWRGLAGGGYRFLRRHGAIVAFYNSQAVARVLSGHAVTAIQLAGNTRLPRVYRIMGGLRPYDASRAAPRLAPPRVPRRLAERLDRRGHSELRRALLSFGPYRFSSCS